MRRISRYVIAAVVCALAITALGAPASAVLADGDVAIVQGIAGKRVDICLDGKEVRSGLRYGGRVFTILLEGQHTLKVFKKDPRRCRGTRLLRKRFTLDPHGDLTIVATRKAPKTVVFDNTGLGLLRIAGTDVGYIVWRDASDLGGTDIRAAVPGFLVPTVDVAGLWQKGDQFLSTGSVELLLVTVATLSASDTTIAGPLATKFRLNWRYEIFLVGTKAKNARFITVRRPLVHIL